jgi:hypothetical protein
MTNLTHIPLSICLFQFPTCFEQPRARHQANQLYQYNIRYVSLLPSSMQVGKELLPDLHTRRSPTQSDTYQMLYWYNWFSWWWARVWSKHVEKWNKHIEKRNYASSWSFTRIIPRCTVNRTQNDTVVCNRLHVSALKWPSSETFINFLHMSQRFDPFGPNKPVLDKVYYSPTESKSDCLKKKY